MDLIQNNANPFPPSLERENDDYDRKREKENDDHFREGKTEITMSR